MQAWFCLRGIQQLAGLCSVQNEVAYEYFGDRFSVTAERKYKQVSCPTNCGVNKALLV